MPNHVESTIRIEGDIAALIEAGFLIPYDEEPAEERVIDFNAVIPMAESLNIESGSRSKLGMAALGADPAEFEFLRSCDWYETRYPGCDTPEKLAANLEENNPEALELGRAAIDNIRLHGYPDWYRWSINNWGTKWNAYDATIHRCEDDHAIVTFSTAWSTPDPIFQKLRDMGYEVVGFSIDEGDNKPQVIGNEDAAYNYFYPKVTVEIY